MEEKGGFRLGMHFEEEEVFAILVLDREWDLKGEKEPGGGEGRRTSPRIWRLPGTKHFRHNVQRPTQNRYTDSFPLCALVL